MLRSFGIHNVKNIHNENKLKTVLPLSVIKYALHSNYKIPYITHHSVMNFQVNYLTHHQHQHIQNLMQDNILTEHVLNDETFINFPPHDIVINDCDYESKLCVYPCHNRSKLFELIIRQNNIACCIQNIIRSNPGLTNIMDDFVQQPYVLISLYDSNGLKPIIISNKALIYMCIESANNTKSNRSTIMSNTVHNMITEYHTHGKIKYKETKDDTVPHQKITLYPTDYLNNLTEVIGATENIPYYSILTGTVQKSRNVCDYINESMYKIEIETLKNEIEQLKQQVK